MTDTTLTAPPGVTPHPFAGHHLLAELYGVVPSKLDDPDLLAGALRRGIERGGATLLHLEVRRFSPHGVTVLALLAESHASLHTYPEAGALFFDAFTCGEGRPQAILGVVASALSPKEVQSRLVERGDLTKVGR